VIGKVVAIDDGFFPPNKSGVTTLSGVLWSRGPEKASLVLITIDGRDGTERALELLGRLGGCESGVTLLLDGIAYAGFNYIDPERVAAKCGIPFIVFFYRPLNITLVENALVKNFADWEERLAVFKRAVSATRVLLTSRGRVYVYTNLGSRAAQNVVEELQVYSPIPEPLRLAHFIASEASQFLRRFHRM